MTKTVHAVVGTGEAPEKVITEGLIDAVNANETVALVWTPKPNKTTELIYDWVLDNDIEFTMFYKEGDTPPRVFRESEVGVVQKVRSSLKAAIEAVEGKGSILYLWDNDAPDEQVDPVFKYKQPKTLVLELTNGLAPITDEVDIPEPTEPEVAQDPGTPVDDTEFTKAELENMGAAAVKRYGARKGTKAATAKGIIQELFPPESEEPGTEGSQEWAENVIGVNVPGLDEVDPEGALASAGVDREAYDEMLESELVHKIDTFLRKTFANY